MAHVWRHAPWPTWRPLAPATHGTRSSHRPTPEKRPAYKKLWQQLLATLPPTTNNAAVLAAWTPKRAMEREYDACYKEGEEYRKIEEGSDQSGTNRFSRGETKF